MPFRLLSFPFCRAVGSVPRAGLDRSRVVAAAAVVADEAGFERFTLAMVAKSLGVRLPSLYNHVEGLEALRDEIAIRALNELAGVLSSAAAGLSRGEALHAVAHAYREYALKCPGRYSATVRAPIPDDAKHTAAASALLDVMLAVLRGYNLHGDDAVDAIRAVRAALHGWAELEKGGAFGMPQDVNRSYHQLITGIHATLALHDRSRPADPLSV
jgi:AcrR family transcriptional regulator